MVMLGARLQSTRSVHDPNPDDRDVFLSTARPKSQLSIERAQLSIAPPAAIAIVSSGGGTTIERY
jgi:hypothetical protein